MSALEIILIIGVSVLFLATVGIYLYKNQVSKSNAVRTLEMTGVDSDQSDFLLTDDEKALKADL